MRNLIPFWIRQWWANFYDTKMPVSARQHREVCDAVIRHNQFLQRKVERLESDSHVCE